MRSIETNFDMPLGLTENVAKGVIKLEDILNWVSNYYSGTVTQLMSWDLTEADLSEITITELKEIVAVVKKKYYLRQNGKTAIVSNGAIEYGIGRIFQGFAETEGIEFEYKVFRKMSEAKEWLGV
jgi:hypothetical protein